MDATSSSRTLTAEDVVVAIADGADGPYHLDPIRLMKGCFLVAQRGREEWKRLFDFRPYDYGPFDQGVYRARDALVSRGLLSVTQGTRYPTYSLTEQGRARAREVARQLGQPDARWLARVGRYVSSKSFGRLLEEIYAAFPEYATRSVVH